MKWFSVEIDTKYHNPDESYRTFSLYDIHSGDIFFKLEVDFNKKNCTYLRQSLDTYLPISDQLKELTLTMEEDQPYSYSRYIKPLFRDKKLSEILK